MKKKWWNVPIYIDNYFWKFFFCFSMFGKINLVFYPRYKYLVTSFDMLYHLIWYIQDIYTWDMRSGDPFYKFGLVLFGNLKDWCYFAKNYKSNTGSNDLSQTDRAEVINLISSSPKSLILISPFWWVTHYSLLGGFS